MGFSFSLSCRLPAAQILPHLFLSFTFQHPAFQCRLWHDCILNMNASSREKRQGIVTFVFIPGSSSDTATARSQFTAKLSKHWIKPAPVCTCVLLKASVVLWVQGKCCKLFVCVCIQRCTCVCECFYTCALCDSRPRWGGLASNHSIQHLLPHSSYCHSPV